MSISHEKTQIQAKIGAICLYNFAGKPGSNNIEIEK